MSRVGIRQLKNQLSEYVRRAAAGETVIVTDRDQPIARLMPIDAPVDKDPLAELIRQGILKPAPRSGQGVTWRRHPVISHEQLMAELDEDREDRV